MKRPRFADAWDQEFNLDNDLESEKASPAARTPDCRNDMELHERNSRPPLGRGEF